MVDTLPDPYVGFELAYTKFDWSDPKHTADSISKQLIGPKPWLYWDLKEYSGMSPWEIERQILFDARRPNWGGVSKHGKPYYQHMLTMGKLLFPEIDITPTLSDFIQVFCMGVGGGNKKIFNLIGSQNSGKSFGSVFLAFCIMYIDPTRSSVFVASPFDVAADATVWGSVEEMWDQMCEAHPNDTGKGLADASSLFIWGRKLANKQLEFIPGLPKAGTIVLKGVKSTGKFKGSKARNSKETDRGVMLLIVDEINEVQNPSFLEMVNNLVSQDQFSACTSQNFKDSEDVGGRITEPVGLYGGPSSFEELDIDADQMWHSAKSSITLRYDGHCAVNILAGRTIYPQLFKKSNLELMQRDYGTASPDYFSQVRSFPSSSSETNSVLSRAKISASGHKDTFYTKLKINGKVAFCDPAFGGRDSAVFGWASFGTATVTDNEGHDTQQELLFFEDFFHKIKLVKDALYNEYWFERMRACGIETATFITGSEVSYEDQIAIYCKEKCKAHGVPANCMGFDSSLRADIVSSMHRMFGFSVSAFDYNQPPEGCFLQNTRQQSVDCCKNRTTELAFLAADYFLTKQVRGGHYIDTAIMQLSRTRYETVSRKYVVEGKKEYKQRFGGASPDHRDVLLGIAGMAQRRGFRQNSVVGKSTAPSVWSILNNNNVGKSRISRLKR